MFKINLLEYKKSKIYFQLFDVILKDLEIKKEDFLIDNDITPSSYRLARKVEQNIGITIIKKLANIYNLKMLEDSKIDEIENKINLIYTDMYYKIYDNYDQYLIYLDELIKDNNILFPIIKLFKLFLLANAHKDIGKFVEENKRIYNEIINYKSFFNETCQEVFFILDISMKEINVSEYVMKPYDNALCYFALSSISLNQGKYMECIYFIDKCKEILINENNYKRLIYLYLKLMQCYLYFGNYHDCYILSKQVISMCKSFALKGYELNSTYKNFITACLALSKYQEAYETINSISIVYNNELIVYLVCCYEIDPELYKTAYEHYLAMAKNRENDRLIKVLHIVNEYIVNSNKKILEEFDDDIMINLIKILKERK